MVSLVFARGVYWSPRSGSSFVPHLQEGSGLKADRNALGRPLLPGFQPSQGPVPGFKSTSKRARGHRARRLEGPEGSVSVRRHGRVCSIGAP